MNNLEVDRLIKELHEIATQLKRIANVMSVVPATVTVEPSPFSEPIKAAVDDLTDDYIRLRPRPDRPAPVRLSRYYEDTVEDD